MTYITVRRRDGVHGESLGSVQVNATRVESALNTAAGRPNGERPDKMVVTRPVPRSLISRRDGLTSELLPYDSVFTRANLLSRLTSVVKPSSSEKIARGLH